MQLIQRGAGELRPLVVVYHDSGIGLLPALAKRVAVASYTDEPRKRNYATISAKNPTLDQLVTRLSTDLDARAFFPIVLVGFSEGCQGIRAQLLRGMRPSATIAIDGVHASNPPAVPQQIDVWRDWFEFCGADFSRPQSACPEVEGKPIAILTFTQIRTGPAVMPTREVAELITGWTMPPGPSPSDPLVQCSGNFWVYSFPGASAAAHVDQAVRVMPAAVASVADELGIGRNSPPPAPGQGPGRAPRTLAASVARRLTPALLCSGALALAIRYDEDQR